MIVNVDRPWQESISPHSLGLQMAITTPAPAWDSNPSLITQKAFWGASGTPGAPMGRVGGGCSGCSKGISGLSFDGSGFLGTGLFSGDITTWGISELLIGAVGAYLVYNMVIKNQPPFLEVTTRSRRRKRE